MEEARAFAPCHITGFLQIFDKSANALDAGSKGAGISLSHGVETHVKVNSSVKNCWRVSINGVVSDSALVSKHVLKAFCSDFSEMKDFEIVVEHNVKAPLGAGFGTSGAAALSLALAINEAFGLGLSKIEAAKIAHVAEVECKTGLGTVIAEAFGGAEIRTKPGAPGIGEIKQMPAPKDTAVACLVFGPLSTRKLLSDQETRERINDLGEKLVDEIVKGPSIANFMKLSRQFAEHVGLITDKMRKILDLADKAGFVCSMPMFGESVFMLAQNESLEGLVRILGNHRSDGQIFRSKIDFDGARVLA